MDRVNGQNTIDLGGGRRGFRGRNTAAGVAGTEVTEGWLNALQEEICGFIEAEGDALDPNSHTQLRLAVQRAIQKRTPNYAVAGGTPNALTISLNPAPKNLNDLIGTAIHVWFTATNSGASTLKIGDFDLKDIRWPNGTVTREGDLPGGAIGTFIFNGNYFQIAGILSDAIFLRRADATANLPIYPELLTTGNILNYTTGAGTLTIVSGQEWIWRGVRRFSSSLFSAAARTFALAANRTYHLIWDAPGTGAAVPASDYPNGAFSLVDRTGAAPAETDPVYDTTYDRILFLRIVTNVTGVPTVTQLINKAVLNSLVITALAPPQSSSGANLAARTETLTVNWARTPQALPSFRLFNVDTTGPTDMGYSDLVRTRYSYSFQTNVDYANQISSQVHLWS